MSGISFAWRAVMSKNICKNRKQNNRVRGGKLGRICDAGNPPSVCLRQNLYEEEKQ